MGSKPNPILCASIIKAKFYVVEVDHHAGIPPPVGCGKPIDHSSHDAVSGYTLSWWVCGEYDCVDGYALLPGPYGAQRLTKVFGPYDDMTEAMLNVW